MDTASASDSGIEVPARWSLRLLGGFELSALPGGEKVASLGTRERALLAFLALSPKGSQPRRKLAALLWGDATDETLLDNLRTSLWRLRKALGDTEHGLIASDGEEIVLDAAAFDVDALAFRRLAAQPGRSELEAAANLYAGELLDGLEIDSEEFESWRRAEATRYRDQTVDVLTRLMTQLGECGESERAIETGLRILRLEPLHEAAIRRLMRLYSESGRRGAAVQLYRTLADALRTELGAQPEAETRAAFAELARGGEERTIGTADARPAVVSTSIARPSDATRGVPRLPTRPAAPWRAALAVLAGVLIVAIALISYRQFASRPAVVAERAASATQASAISIAVLPFVNLSGDTGQEFFSDGITEEITSALAKVPDLRVVARTSAFEFKGQNRNIKTMGKELGATHLIEGSVRKAGDRVRITVQLIKADDGTHVWSEDYDRQLTDIFATQEDIARAITTSLRMPLGLKPGENLVNNRNIDPESYQQFLRAHALIQGRGLKPITDATALLERLVARHPDFAPAWSELSGAYALTPNARPERNGTAAEYRRVVDEFLPKAEAAARRAIELDPNFARGYAQLAGLQYSRGKALQADEYYSKALALDPTGSSFLQGRSEALGALGRPKEALALRRQLQSLEPFVPVLNDVTSAILWVNGRNDEAIAIAKALPPNRPNRLAMIYASMGRYGEAADAVLEMRGGINSPSRLAEAAQLLRSAPAKVDSPEKLPELGTILSWIYLYVGAPDRVLGSFETVAEGGRLPGQEMAWLWHPSYAPVRKTERFKAFMRKVGFVDYWRAKGWPDLCRPVGADDFVCQ